MLVSPWTPQKILGVISNKMYIIYILYNIASLGQCATRVIFHSLLWNYFSFEWIWLACVYVWSFPFECAFEYVITIQNQSSEIVTFTIIKMFWTYYVQKPVDAFPVDRVVFYICHVSSASELAVTISCIAWTWCGFRVNHVAYLSIQQYCSLKYYRHRCEDDTESDDTTYFHYTIICIYKCRSVLCMNMLFHS